MLPSGAAAHSGMEVCDSADGGESVRAPTPTPAQHRCAEVTGRQKGEFSTSGFPPRCIRKQATTQPASAKEYIGLEQLASRRQDMDVKWVMKDGLGESKQTQLSFPGTTC